MSIRNMLLVSVALAVTTPTLALADEIIVEHAPPPMETESPPAERPGYIWAPGYQRWNNDHYEWVKGHWVEAKVHNHWVPDKWAKEDEGHWRYEPGHWEAD